MVIIACILLVFCVLTSCRQSVAQTQLGASPLYVSDTILYKDHSYIVVRERFNTHFEVLHSPSCRCRYNRHFVVVSHAKK